jgi:hypothetical protein
MIHIFDKHDVLKIAEGNQEALGILHTLSQYKRADQFYAWILKHTTFRGQKFVEWFRFAHQGSPMYLAQWLTARLEREKQCRPLFTHKDLA